MFEITKSIIFIYREMLDILKGIIAADDACKTAIGAMQEFSSNKQGFNVMIERFIDLLATHDTLEAAIGDIDSKLTGLEGSIGMLDGLDAKVVTARDIEGKSLKTIADELGYSYDYVREISSRNKKPTFNPHTA